METSLVINNTTVTCPVQAACTKLAGMAKQTPQQAEAIRNLLAALMATHHIGLTPGDIGAAVAIFLFESGQGFAKPPKAKAAKAGR